MKKAEAQLLILLIIVGLPIYLVGQAADIVGPTNFVAVVLAAAILAVVWYKIAKKKKRERLLKKYGNAEIVEKIMGGYFWQGQSEEQLIESLGKPADIDEKILKTKSKEIWKYNHQGANRYGLRITLENGVVVGWDKRD